MASEPEHFIFTLNCSDALNLAIKGLVDSAWRPRDLHAYRPQLDPSPAQRTGRPRRDRNRRASRLIRPTGLVDPDDIRRAIRPDTRFIAITHVSNVTGTVQPIREIGQIAREAGVPFIVDAAQSAGHLPIDVQADMIDLLAAPGHKGLLGPLGTGFLYIRPGIEKMLRTTP